MRTARSRRSGRRPTGGGRDSFVAGREARTKIVRQSGGRVRWVVRLGLGLGLGLAALGGYPTVRALTRSKAGFTPDGQDGRVWFEEGAEAMADSVAAFLPRAIETIEAAHGRPFRKSFRVYVCATQRSLNGFLALDADVPVRGMVRFGEIFLGPSAFDWRGEDLHRESLLHEMSHLHLRQQVGLLASRRSVPSWFHEGLADLVSGAGGEGVSDEEATRAILGGRSMHSDSAGRLWSLARMEDYGLGGPMLHRQSRMFLSWLRDRNPAAFAAFLSELQREGDFARAFRNHLGGGVRDAWLAFVASLDAERAKRIDRQGPSDRDGHGENDRAEQDDDATEQGRDIGG
jgi:hypothetical protein